MSTKLAVSLIFAIAVALSPSVAFAATPSFVVKCVRTAGSAEGEKYGTYYFYLRDGFVKGSACDVPGQPCQIVSQNPESVVFQTPGESPDTLTIDLRTGAIERTRSNGDHWAFSCKQVPYQP
ncbi:MAG: IPT/TIG domain-containing protein [Alphaproteobacteria bacterium]|nr:IPT/TIG domain-containing protein [Alphaproteobacteria bacterium]